jgi:cytoskeleton protein RodZ
VVQPLPQPAAESPAADATLAAAPISAPPAAVPGTRQLVFSFDGSSWVEVKEASGRIVFSQMNAKGTTQVVEGRPPFQLVVGNASHVRLQYNDQPVDLRPHTWVEVARLTLE